MELILLLVLLCLASLIATPILAIRCKQLSARLADYEQRFENQTIETESKYQTCESPKPLMPSQSQANSENDKDPPKILSIIKDNWLTVLGGLAVIVGIVSFGLATNIMAKPEYRVGMILLGAFALLGIGQWLGRLPHWRHASSWLQPISGAIILFACIGASQIPGLKFINIPFFATCAFGFGVTINLVLSILTPKQWIASFHVLLSLVAFNLTPHTTQILPISTLIICIGLISAYRRHWDLHMLLIMIAYAVQNTYWKLCLIDPLIPWIPTFAVGSATLLACLAAAVHYKRKLDNSQSNALSITAHISNWGLLMWNLSLYAYSISWIWAVFMMLSIATFTLAYYAKRKRASWLYLVNVLTSQAFMIATIISSALFLQFNELDVGMIVLSEIIAFNIACQIKKENTLLRYGYCLQYVASTLYLFLLADYWIDTTAVSLRLGCLSVASWALAFYYKDNGHFISTGKNNAKSLPSITSIFGTIYFLSLACLHQKSLIMNSIVLIIIGLLAVQRKIRENGTWNVNFALLVLASHIYYIGLFALPGPIHSTLWSSGWSLVALDIILIFGNFLVFRQWKINCHDILIYGCCLLAGLICYDLLQSINPLIPCVGCLVLSVGLLEAGHIVRKFLYTDSVKLTIQRGLTHTGSILLLGFFKQFTVMLSVSDPSISNDIARWVIEGAGLLAIRYWIMSYPKKKYCSPSMQFNTYGLTELFLVFLTLCLFIELPISWIGIPCAACGIILMTQSKRLQIYSYGYYILTSLSMIYTRSWHPQVITTIILQLGYICLIHHRGNQKEPRPSIFVLRQPILATHLPLFLNLAILCFSNIPRVFITLSWVGLACGYLLVGLWLKARSSIKITMISLLLCSFRLTFYDLARTDLITRAMTFVGAGALMLILNMLYNRYKKRVIPNN